VDAVLVGEVARELVAEDVAVGVAERGEVLWTRLSPRVLLQDTLFLSELSSEARASLW
jgi:hypothetical protein